MPTRKTKVRAGSTLAPQVKEATQGSACKVEVVQSARSGIIAEGGISSARDFAKLMGALMSDIINGRVGPQVANAAVNAGAKLLKVVEMQHKYGKSTKDHGKELNLLS